MSESVIDFRVDDQEIVKVDAIGTGALAAALGYLKTSSKAGDRIDREPMRAALEAALDLQVGPSGSKDLELEDTPEPEAVAAAVERWQAEDAAQHCAACYGIGMVPIPTQFEDMSRCPVCSPAVAGEQDERTER